MREESPAAGGRWAMAPRGVPEKGGPGLPVLLRTSGVLGSLCPKESILIEFISESRKLNGQELSRRRQSLGFMNIAINYIFKITYQVGLCQTFTCTNSFKYLQSRYYVILKISKLMNWKVNGFYQVTRLVTTGRACWTL